MLDFNAGKYAVFVWPAYGLTALVFAGLIADTLARARRWRRAAEEERTAAPLDDDGRDG
jgi:heme exporter protein D